MSEQPQGQREGTLREQRVYYEADSGNVVHVHRYVADADMDEHVVRARMDAFEDSLRQRHSQPIEYLVVDEAELLGLSGPDSTVSVDVTSKTLTSTPTK